MARTGRGEYGRTRLTVTGPSPLFADWPPEAEVWMSHADSIATVPDGFVVTASSPDAPVAGLGDPERAIYGVQFHPEVVHTERGRDLLERFLYDVCRCPPTWTHTSVIESASVGHPGPGGRSRGALRAVRRGRLGGSRRARAQGHRRSAHLCLRRHRAHAGQREPSRSRRPSAASSRIDLVHVKAADRFFAALAGVTDPEEKRKIIGELFIRIFEEVAVEIADVAYLAQGTLYPDVIESGSDSAATIKSHHNVGGLPDDMDFELVEPLRLLFKDEVRAVGEELGLPPEIVWRQPFPGPGLAVRIIGEVTPDRAAILRAADAIVVEEIRRAGLDRELWQCFAVLPVVRTVGVMGDETDLRLSDRRSGP